VSASENDKKQAEKLARTNRMIGKNQRTSICILSYDHAIFSGLICDNNLSEEASD
jgi:hypothetical protein